MLVLGGIGLNWVSGADVRLAGILLAAFVFPVEFLAAVIALLARDAETASGLGLFSVSWLALGLVHILAPPGATRYAVGLFLIAFAAMVAGIGGVAMLGKRLLGVILLIAAVRALLSAAYQLGSPAPVEQAQGGVAVLIFAIAVYAGIAFLLEDMLQRTVLPVLRRSAARESFEGDLGEQLERLDHEAGVRRQL
jgi:succinate-acetate transporter protein